MSTYQAYLGQFNPESGSFLRHSFLGGFQSQEALRTAYESSRTETSPHMIVAKMDEHLTRHLKICKIKNGNGL